MVLRNIEAIKKALPEVEHIVMFYDDGTIFQTSFEQKMVNIPKLGESLSEIITHRHKIYEMCNFEKDEEYKKIIFETENVCAIILKLGEKSNLALFFKQVVEKKGLRIRSIRRYIERIEELIDINRIEVYMQELKLKEGTLHDLHLKLEPILEKQKEIQEHLSNPDLSHTDEEIKVSNLELEKLNGECIQLTKEIEEKNAEITNLKEKINSEVNTNSEDQD